MSAVIEIHDLRKTYRRLLPGSPSRPALAGLDLVVDGGAVHGLLGPAGAGKSTALRVLLGLTRADAGTMRVLGQPVPAAWPVLAPRVGAAMTHPHLVDRTPGWLTGRRRLRLLATAGGVPARRVDEVLAWAGLAELASTPIRRYPPAARQRLGVAAALLKAPELVILDEPTAGLDRAEAGEVAVLIREVAAGGVTVLVASRGGGGLDQLYEHVTIIVAGRRAAGGPVTEVLASHDLGEFRVRVDDLARAGEILTETGLPVTTHPDHLVVGDLADAAWLAKTLGRYGLWVSELTPLAPSLATVVEQLAAAQTGEPGLPEMTSQPGMTSQPNTPGQTGEPGQPGPPGMTSEPGTPGERCQHGELGGPTEPR